MRTPSTRRFPGLKEVLRKGNTGIINAPSTTGKGRKRKRTSIVPRDSRSPVYVSIYEGKGTLRGQIGVASIDPSTTEFHLFNFAVSEGFTSLKSLLQSLLPSDVIIYSMASPELKDAVMSVCQRADISTTKKTYYDDDDGKAAFSRLTDSIVRQDLKGKEACLSAFAALVKFAEHQSNSVFAPSSCTINFNGIASLMITCPLCENDNNVKKPCKMGTIKQFQEHFFHHHWQVHGYACHLCGQMYSTAEQLMTQHVECDEWTRWKAARENERQEKLPMLFCRMMLCCADCGWHTTLSEKEEKNEETKMNYLSSFLAHHNNDGLLSMLVYFPGDPTNYVEAIKFNVHLTVGGDPTASCGHCHTGNFKDPSAANEHYMKHHNKKAVECGIDGCNARIMTEYILEQHKFQHVHENSVFADFLSNSARIFPPPTNLSSASRSGWKDRAKTEDFAFGGVIGLKNGTGKKFYNLVEQSEDDMRQAKAIMIKKRNRFDKDKGYANAVIPRESDMARGVRLKLEKYRDCDAISGLLDDTTWLRDEDAAKFQDWMDYWESEEGKELGGSPKENLYVDVGPSIVRIPSVEVELQFTDKDVLSGFLLNDNVFYCTECDSIHKGQEAFDHLKKDGEEPSNCAKQETGEVEINPSMNGNMLQLFSSSVCSPSSSLPCPFCPRRACCSITGLRVHIMAAHGDYVTCKKAQGEVVGSVASLVDGLRQKGTKKRRIRKSGDKMKDGEGRKRDDEDGRSVQGQAENAGAVIQAEGGVVEAEVEADLVPLEDNGDTDNDVVMMTEDEVEEDDGVLDVPSMEVENDEDIEAEKEVETEEQIQPVVRHFSPDGDDDLCVVGEVNTGFSAFQPTIANQREKKFGCPRCSERFMTSVRLDDHLETHRLDAGETTIAEELGIPLATRLFICKNCCLAFPTPEMKANHLKQHDGRSVDCETCCGFAFNQAVLTHHLNRVKTGEVSYICGECQLSFDNETNLHEHSNARHGVTLFYFCKSCEIGSTNGVDVYNHYMRERCPKVTIRKMQKDAVKCIGVVPANQLHFQPISLDIHRVVLDMHPNKYVDPSVCTHRSMNVATERKITCGECRGTMTMATYVGEYEAKTGKEYTIKANAVRCQEPLAVIRVQFQKMLIEQQKKVNELTMGRVAPPSNRYYGNAIGGGGAGPSRSVATVSSGSVRILPSMMRTQPATVRPALTPLTARNTHEAGPSRDARQSMPNPPRNQNAMAFLGATTLADLLMPLGTATTRRDNGGGGGMMRDSLAQSPMGNQNGGGGMMMKGSLAQSPMGNQNGGGGMMMRDSPVLAQSPMGNQNVLGAAMRRGGVTIGAARAKGEPPRMMAWARQRGYSVVRDTKDLAGRPMLPSNLSHQLQSMEEGGAPLMSISTPSTPSPTQNTPSIGL